VGHRRGAAGRMRDQRHFAEDFPRAHAADALAAGDQADLALEQEVHLVPAHQRDGALVLGEDLLAFGDRRGLAGGLEEFERHRWVVGRGGSETGLRLRIHRTSLGITMPPEETTMQGKIGLEEHFAIPETLNDSKGYLPDYTWPEL